MKQFIIFKNKDALDRESLNDFKEYIKLGVESGVLVIDERITYEVIKLDD